ncbi:MAG TPA: adenylate/guanylate cyclase domain-containing protein [Actinomycetota bacterium]|nr:adenylate/guanylate cyclase domain-containing protein [Actinomycetota bacterium]
MGSDVEIRYARSTGDIDIAYTVLGEGPVDLVYVSGFITHLDLAWDLPHFDWLHQFDGVARVIVFDKRGTGLSDRSLGFGSLEERADDIRAVMDAAGSERAFVFGVSEGGPMAILFAATHPDRAHGLILYGTAARFAWSPDLGAGVTEEVAAPLLDFIEQRWGSGEVFSMFVQHAADPVATTRLIARFERNACTPQMAREIMERNLEIDVRKLLPAIGVPTLVLHNSGDPVVDVRHARYMAERIPGATYIEAPGDFHGSWRPEHFVLASSPVLGFISGQTGAPAPLSDRRLATVVFTDIEASTESAAAVGDERWRSMLDHHDRLASRVAERTGGRLVKGTGDGVLATFDGPGRGIAFAREFQQALLPSGIRIRTGVHTGEIEMRGTDVSGVGVVIARRICDTAVPGEVLVSRTVKDLVAGSGIGFDDRGTHELKGVPDEWQLFAVSP